MPGVSSWQQSVNKQDIGADVRSLSHKPENSKVKRKRKPDNLKEHQLIV